MTRTSPLSIAAAAAAALSAGCMNHVADHCTGCAVVQAERPAAPRVAGRSLVVLVHGAFGFGPEWAPVVAAVREAGLPFVVFAWRGPFRDLTGTARDLTALVQGALDLSPALTDVLVLAHSAGGPLATRAALGLRVPLGRRVQVAELDPPAFMTGPPFFRAPLAGPPPLPEGVSRSRHHARRPPRDAAPEPGRVYLGAGVSHGQAVARAGLPLLRELAARSAAPLPFDHKEITWAPSP